MTTYTTKTFTAFTSADLFGSYTGGVGSTFTMPSDASVTMSVSDDDLSLSGDLRWNDHADDLYVSGATITDENGTSYGNGGKIYGEEYLVVRDQYGREYHMVRIEQEGTSDDYFAFDTDYGFPPAGSQLTVVDSYNVNKWFGDMPKYEDLTGGNLPEEKLGSICGRFFLDEDGDGTERDANTGAFEKGVANQYVTLYNGNGNAVARTTTDANGNYSFDGLKAGYYYVDFDNNTGLDYTARNVGSDRYDSDVDNGGGTKYFYLGEGQKVSDVDAGVVAGPNTGSISGTVWTDLDCDGIQEFGSQFIGESVYTDMSRDRAGFTSSFTVDEAGKYQLKFDQYGSYKATYIRDSEVSVYVNGQFIGKTSNKYKLDDITYDIELNAGANKIEFRPTGTNIYYKQPDIDDIRVNKIETVEPENGRAGVTVKLINANGDEIATTQTDADGNYRFDDVPAGDYTIMGVAPNGTEFTIQDAGSNDNADSDVDQTGMSGTVTVTPDGNADVDLGVCKTKTGAITGTVWHDQDCDGVQELAGNATLSDLTELTFSFGGGYITYDNETNSTTLPSNLKSGDTFWVMVLDDGYTKALNLKIRDLGNGEFSLEVVAGKYTAGSVYNSINGDFQAIQNYFNANGNAMTVADGLTQAGYGIHSISINGQPIGDGGYLKKGTPTTFSATIDGEQVKAGVTIRLLDTAGNVVAETQTDENGNYRFDNVPAGEYKVMGVAPDGTEFTISNAGSDDSVDSDVDQGTGTATVTVRGDETSDIDMGLCEIKVGSLSGRYFTDANRDGLDNDGADNGIAGVTVELLDANGNPTGRTTTTDANGNYSFGNLIPGNYGVKFTDTVSGQTLTTQNVDNDASDDIDSDANDVGGGMSVINGIAVTAGNDTPDNDAGVYPNDAPMVTDDAGKGCADEEIKVDFSDNYSDSDSASASITKINGQSITDGGPSVMVDGVEVTLLNDQFIFNGEDAYAGLDIGEEASKSFTVTVEDSDGAEAMASIDVTFKGDANSVESLYQSLPAAVTYEVIYAIDEGATFPSYGFDLRFLETGDDRFDGVLFEQAYCLDFNTAVRTIAEGGPDNTGELFGSQSDAAKSAFDANTVSNANGLAGSENLDLINWVISQNFESKGYSGWEVQFAIWELADNFDSSLVNYDNFADTDLASVDEILNAALLQDGFEFSAGDTVSMIVDPGTGDADNAQPFIVALDWEKYDCLC